MIGISAQLSLYPLRQEQLRPAVDDAIELLEGRGLDVRPGAMSTVVSGDDEVVFDAVRDVLRAAAVRGDVVMVATFSNACPVAPPPSTSQRD